MTVFNPSNTPSSNGIDVCATELKESGTASVNRPIGGAAAAAEAAIVSLIIKLIGDSSLFLFTVFFGNGVESRLDSLKDTVCSVLLCNDVCGGVLLYRRCRLFRDTVRILCPKCRENNLVTYSTE